MDLDVWQILPIAMVAAGGVRLAPFVPQRLRIPGSIVIFLGFLCWAPFAIQGFQTLQLTRILVWLVVAMGLNILTGYNGQISLGHGALLALGAYTSAILMDSTEQLSFIDATPWPFWTTIIAAGFVTAAFGVLIGIPALRLRGPYLAIATLAVAISFPIVMRKYDGLTGGVRGILVRRPDPPGFLDGALNNTQWIYFLGLFVAVLMLVGAWFLLRSSLGRSFVAVRDSEVAAEAMGINIARTKVTAFAVSAFYAGIAGGMYMQVFGFISPDSISLFASINLLAAIVVGGLASILGSVIGAGALIFLPTDAPGLVGRIPGLSIDFFERAPGAIQGAAVILTVIAFPAGLAGFLHRLERLERLTPATAAQEARAVLSDGLARLESWGARVYQLRGARPVSPGPSQKRADRDLDDRD